MDVLQQADISFTLMRVTTLFCFDAKNHASKFCFTWPEQNKT